MASGAAAITYAITALARKGDHVVAQRTVYGGTFNLLQHTLRTFGIETTFVDTHNLKSVESAVKENTKLIFIETLGNPHSDISDIDAIAKIAHKNKIPLVIDNTFGTPYLIRPIEHGADVVVHSATKFIGGHGTTLGGIIVDSGKFDWAASGKFPQFTEKNPSYGIPFVATGATAYAIYIRTILLRDEGGSIFTFDIKGGQAEAFKFIDSLKIFSLLANVADVKSLVIHPYTTTHSELTPEELAAAEITPATIRVSIGTEHYEDIVADLENGFATI